MTQCSTSEIGDAPLYNPCSLPIQVMTARVINGLPQITGMCLGWWKQSFRQWLLSLVWFQVRATSCHLTSSKSAWKSTPNCTWMCWRVWWSPGAIRWLVAVPECGSRTWRWLTSPKTPRLGFRRSATTLYPSLTGSPPPLTWTCWTTLFGYTLRTSPTWPLTTSKPAWSPPSAGAPTGACGKGMLPVPDPYWGSDWVNTVKWFLAAAPTNWASLISLFNGISTFVGYFIPKSSL